MQPLYNVNGLVFWNEQEIRFRNYAVDYLATGIRDAALPVLIASGLCIICTFESAQKKPAQRLGARASEERKGTTPHRSERIMAAFAGRVNSLLTGRR